MDQRETKTPLLSTGKDNGRPVKSGVGWESQFGIKKGVGETEICSESTDKKQKQVGCPVGKSLQVTLCDAARKDGRSSERSSKEKRSEARRENRHRGGERKSRLMGKMRMKYLLNLMR